MRTLTLAFAFMLSFANLQANEFQNVTNTYEADCSCDNIKTKKALGSFYDTLLNQQTVINGAPPILISFTQSVFPAHHITSNASSKRFTVQRSGIYLINWNMTVGNPANLSSRTILASVYVNETAVPPDPNVTFTVAGGFAGLSSLTQVTGSVSVLLKAGDKVSLRAVSIDLFPTALTINNRNLTITQVAP
ncbi:MAG: hypothetical protein H0W88_12530 [Parachlamydiaceae bacterium]|nr:hypothetical protein [Parachlamydiaceae bacterium]